MLNEIYTAIKDQASGLELNTQVYNSQYEGVMTHDNGLFVEFPEELKFDPASKDMRRAPVKIRVHYYSKAMATNDGIPDSSFINHEAIAETVENLLDGWTPANNSCKRLTFTGWRHWHRWRGWMVTFIEFDAKKIL